MRLSKLICFIADKSQSFLAGGGARVCSLVLALTLIGCSYSIEIIVSGLDSGRPTFTFHKPKLAAPRGESQVVSLKSFDVFQKRDGEWNYRDPMWSIEPKAGVNIEVDKINYGMEPQGFIETVKARHLDRGVVYLAVARVSGGGGGVEFILK